MVTLVAIVTQLLYGNYILVAMVTLVAVVTLVAMATAHWLLW